MDFADDDDEEFLEHPNFSRILGMFAGNPSFQRIVKRGLFATSPDTNESREVDWDNCPFNPEFNARRPDLSSALSFQTRSINSIYQEPYFFATADQPPVKDQAEESDPEKTGALLQRSKKHKGKAEKSRLKNQKKKEKKRLVKMEKEKQNPANNQNGEVQNLESKLEEDKQIDKSKNAPNSRDKPQAAAKETDFSDSCDEESSDEDSDAQKNPDIVEGLDMSSLFVSKAAGIVQRKLEQNSKPEKKSIVKEEPRTSPKKADEKPATEKDCEAGKVVIKDYAKLSTDLANTGNKFASAGNFSRAVLFFTDAIKYNPTEFKLFGNRSFCFERMQEYEKALTDAELSLSMCPGWVKGLFRKGRALAGLKRYDEACQAFRQVLAVDGSCAEAAQELMRVQITQVMEFGFTQEQSSNALIIHGTVKKAVEVLCKLNRQGPGQNGVPTAALATNVSRASPELRASNSAFHPPKSQDSPVHKKPLGSFQIKPNFQSQPKPFSQQATNTRHEDPQGVFPVWVGNLFQPVTESDLKRMFNRAGFVSSVKLLAYKRCAFVNYTKQEYCDAAIRYFNGYDLNGSQIIVRYPDRIARGMGISDSALTSLDNDERSVDFGSRRTVVGRSGTMFSYSTPMVDWD